jgi:hypothetical protein
MKPDIRKRLLDMVVARLGKDAVAKRLRVPVSTIENWMREDTQIPEHRLVDLIDALEETLKK